MSLLVVEMAISACGGDDTEAGTFIVKGYLIGTTDDRSGFERGVSCEFYDGIVTVGDPVIVRGADDTILGKTALVDIGGLDVGPACSFGFTVAGIKAGEAAYTIAAGPYDPIVVTEEELRDKDFGLGARRSRDAANGERIPLKVRLSGD